ncbi:MAG TPA: DUF1854 domain-containing protein [Tepidisphaeraceae bacterium]|jgi:hypothetical protein
MTDFQLTENPNGTMTLSRPGHSDVVDVRLRRSFPWSKPQQLISVRDDKGKEIFLIENLTDLSPAQRGPVDRWMAANAFIPTISRVRRLNVDFGHQEWEVETDRGNATFRVQEREDIRFLPDGRFSIKDVDGNIYALPRLDTLDRESLRAVEPIL